MIEMSFENVKYIGLLQSNRMFVSAEYCNIVGNIAILIVRLL